MVRRALALVVAALALGACFKTSTTSVVAPDGSAATSVVIELDIARIEQLFGGFAEAFDDGSGDAVPGFEEEIRDSLDEVQDELDELYEQRPELRDRLVLDASIEDGVLRTEIAAVTRDVAGLEAFLGSVLGSGDADLSEVLGVEGVDELFEDTEGELGGGTGFFTDISVELDGDEFRFEATTPATGGEEDLEFEFDLFAGFAPEVTVTITAPGEIRDTNGDVDGRTVTWTLDGTDAEPLQLTSAVGDGDPITSLDAIGASSSGGDDDGFPAALVVVGALVLAGIGIGAFLAIRRNSNPTAVDTAPPATDAEVASFVPPPPASTPDGPPVAPTSHELRPDEPAADGAGPESGSDDGGGWGDGGDGGSTGD